MLLLITTPIWALTRENWKRRGVRCDTPPNYHLTCFGIAVCVAAALPADDVWNIAGFCLSPHVKNVNLKAKWLLHVGGQGSRKSKRTSKLSVSFQIRVLNDDGANTKFWFFKLGLCARGAGNPAVAYSKPRGVIHTSQEAGEGTVLPQDTKTSRSFPAVGNVPHPQIRSTDVSQSRGCRKTEGEKVQMLIYSFLFTMK